MSDAIQTLVIEDEPNAIYMPQHLDTLKKQGLYVELVTTFEAGKAALEKSYDLAIIDVYLSATEVVDQGNSTVLDGSEGFFLAALARKRWPDIGIVLLSGVRLEPEDIIEGLDSGADAYIDKTDKTDVFAAKVRSVINRQGPREFPLLRVGRLTLNRKGRLLGNRQGRAVRLTEAETKVIELLVQANGGVVSRKDLLIRAMNRPADVEIDGTVTNPRALRSVDGVVSNLRRKVKSEIDESLDIRSAYGVGYRLENDWIA